MNSARRTAPGSHPDSDSAFLFSPGGAALRPFLFLHLPPSPHGLSGRLFLPRAGGSVPGVSGAASGAASGGGQRSFQRSLRRGCPRAFRPAGPPVARPSAGPGGAAAVLPAFPAGPPFFAACPPFSPACPPFSPARSPRFPAYLLFGLQNRVQAFYPFYGVFLARSGGGGGAQRVPDGPQGPFPCGS